MNFTESYDPVPVPDYFKDDDLKIRECHRLMKDAMGEILEFWADGNNAHVESGMATLKRSALEINDCVESFNLKMKGLKKD